MKYLLHFFIHHCHKEQLYKILFSLSVQLPQVFLDILYTHKFDFAKADFVVLLQFHLIFLDINQYLVF